MKREGGHEGLAGGAYGTEEHRCSELYHDHTFRTSGFSEKFTAFGASRTIGVGRADWLRASPPSEPYGRISRIRLSGRWSYLRED